MTSQDTKLTDLLTALGKRLGLAQPLAFGPVANIVLEHSIVGDVGIELAAGGEAVRFFAFVGSLPGSEREAFLIRLLRANLFNSELEPATLSLGPDDERILVAYTLFLADVDETIFENVLSNFITIAARWKAEFGLQASEPNGEISPAMVNSWPQYAIKG
jgi:hypothetical protein